MAYPQRSIDADGCIVYTYQCPRTYQLADGTVRESVRLMKKRYMPRDRIEHQASTLDQKNAQDVRQSIRRHLMKMTMQELHQLLDHVPTSVAVHSE